VPLSPPPQPARAANSNAIPERCIVHRKLATSADLPLTGRVKSETPSAPLSHLLNRTSASKYPRPPFAGLGFAQRWMARFVGCFKL
jgi:hypothetical protein